MLLLGTLAGAASLTASFVILFRPVQDGAGRADAVVVLSGDHGERLVLGLRLIQTGVASTLVLDGEPDSKEARRLCDANVPFEVVCLRPAHDNTRNEARAVGQLARSRRWRRVVVATTTLHVTRARLLFRRCIDGDVRVLGAQPPYGRGTQTRAAVHEWLAILRALTLERSC